MRIIKRLISTIMFIGITCWTVISLIPWATEMIIVSSFFAFFPLIPFLIPFFGPLMLFKNKDLVITGFLCSLLSLLYLLNAIISYPITLYMGEEMSKKQYVSIILSLIVYFCYSVILFIVRIQKFKNLK